MEKITQCLIFPELGSKPIHLKFDEPHSSSDGGALLLKAADQKLQLTSSLAACLVDKRKAAKVKHTLEDLLCQRIYGLASGYADANDAARLAPDPVFKLLLGSAPLDGPDLSSQPTLSRFENRIGPRENYRLGAALAETVINRHQRRRHRKAKRVTIDLDSTEDPTHGQQEFTFFNRHYDTYCYLPLLAFISFDDEPEQYLVTALLRPSNLTEKTPDVVGLLSRLVSLVRKAFPKALLNMRLDGGFACPAMLDYLDSVPRLEYVCGLSKNAVLERRAQPFLAQARRREKQGRKPRVYGECRYRAQSWERSRRVIIKAEIVHHLAGEAKDNPRFVVTNKSQWSPKTIYRRAYCSRGEIENRIKELQLGMQIDRPSCTRFQANQFRVLLTVAAYALMQEIRLQAKSTSLARAQVTTLRQHLLKLSARIEQSVRRLVLHLPQSFAYLNEWTHIARRLGAAPT
jgi:DDE family transposase